MKAEGRKELDIVYVSSGNLHRLQQDARIITMIGSFLDLSGVMSSWLLKEVCDDKSSWESRKAVDTLLDIES